jgi:hypothetical protein
MGDLDAGILDIEAGLAAFEAAGWTAHLPQVRMHLADALRERGADTDRRRADELLHRAREGAVHHGADALVAKIDGLLGP